MRAGLKDGSTCAVADLPGDVGYLRSPGAKYGVGFARKSAGGAGSQPGLLQAHGELPRRRRRGELGLAS